MSAPAVIQSENGYSARLDNYCHSSAKKNPSNSFLYSVSSIGAKRGPIRRWQKLRDLFHPFSDTSPPPPPPPPPPFHPRALWTLVCHRRRWMGGSIRGHHPKSSLGDKILTIREGVYKNCFREGAGKHFLGFEKDVGRKFPSFFHKNY